ncbi:MAG: tetratricopeptide repeat protein [Bryobacteraceae bacterium]|jgi:predicted O-linked N-acetylglucosamine transferase (SPINDLY family)
MGTEADDLDEALMHHRAGRLAEAAAGYRAVLLRNPRQPDALYLLGMVAHQTGRSEPAIRMFRQALVAKPDHAHCWNLLGLALAAAGDEAGAEEGFRRALAIEPAPGFFLNLGNLLKARGRSTEAADAYGEALRRDAGFAAAHYSLGNLNRAAGGLEEAAACFRRALDAEPGHGDSLAALGQTLQALGRAPEALPFLEQAARRAPGDAGLACDLGDALAALGRGADAARCYETAISIEPGLGRAWFASGCLERDRHDYADAAERFQQACQLRPEWAEAHHNLGQALFQTGQVDEALGEFEVAAEAGSGDISRAMAAVIVPGGPDATNATILAVRQDWARRVFPAVAKDDRPQNAMVCPTKLRIGYLSSFFHRRNWMKPVWGAIHGHDRASFEIDLFSDAPEQAIGEEYRRSAGDVFHDISGLSNEAAAATIEQSGVDVLVDLNGYSAMARLPVVAARPAPVVIGWFNLYATSGMEAYDWLVGDAVVVPAGEERFYCERIARVPGTYLAFEVGYPTPDATAPPCLASGGRLAFGSLASQYKITPEVLPAWSAILRQAPGSTLLIKNAGLEAEGMRRFVRARFEREGIGADRLVLEGPAEHDEFLQSYGRIDVALDPFPYNGGTTTAEALWQGVPVVCFRGDRWAARTSASIEMAAGLGEFVAADRAGYVALAVELARNPETPARLAELRRNMRDGLRASAACDTAGLARHLELIYREAVVFSPR